MLKEFALIFVRTPWRSHTNLASKIRSKGKEGSFCCIEFFQKSNMSAID